MRLSYHRDMNSSDMILSEEKSKLFNDNMLDTINSALQAKGISARQASIAVVGHDGLIRDIRAGRVPSADRIAALYEYLGLEAYFGIPRETGDAKHTIIEGDTYAIVPYLGIDAFSGAKVRAKDDQLAMSYAFRRDWFAKRGIAPQDARMFFAPDNSMAPLIREGDVLVLDATHRPPPVTPRGKKGQRRAKIYVVDVDGETSVKWVERPDMKQIILFSENHANNPPDAFAGKDQNRLVFRGKVIWWSHTIET
ncbi:helix-turn-helix transcriptional regulator [Cognatiyoonia sp. IB215182]|uniref:S24 family peptidase n=1 Tax=Cognatiyoonia sp. IB215182 TaxID=3097353 RepID=UPI002A0DB575|nr:S24 family peptidase [Cognatiyoonia sp. IB215182]MDX8354323.1 S24 family peptidase [Cognatiyoonia sp. IB215182]